MRVSFTLTRYSLESGKLIAALREVFGNRIAKYANCNVDVQVECSADRFVRFQVARNAHGAANGFKDLDLKIIHPKPKYEPRISETFD